MKQSGCLYYLIMLLLIVGFLTLVSQPDHVSPSTVSLSIPADVVQRAPSIDADMVKQVLQTCHSPALSAWHDLYTLGVQYQIDPAVALAFFHHESTCGRYGVALVNKSLGNIRCSSGYACFQGFRAYASWRDGIEDWYRLIQSVYFTQGHTTIETIVPVYAPASENDVHAYIASVMTDLARWREGKV